MEPYDDWNYENGRYSSSLMQDHTYSGDYGPEPLAVNMTQTVRYNRYFRRILWTGRNMQLTLMCIPVCEEISLEMHDDTDQLLMIEEGQGVVRMGASREHPDYQRILSKDIAVLVPAGTWHQIVNTGRGPLKLFSVYAPPKHPFGTIHETIADARANESIH